MKTRNLLVSVLMVVCGMLAACAPVATPTQAPALLPPTPTVAPAAEVPEEKIVFHSPENEAFHFPLSFTHGPAWETNVHSNAIDIVYKNQWGVGILLLNEALVHDPATAVSNQPATANKADYVPLPDDFFAYLTSLPGVEIITAATPTTIGGVEGLQVVIKTPPMHPILWLKDDYTWLGGGATGVDPVLKRVLILLEVNGEQILLDFSEAPYNFDERYPLVQEIFNSITFGK